MKPKPQPRGALAQRIREKTVLGCEALEVRDNHFEQLTHLSVLRALAGKEMLEGHVGHSPSLARARVKSGRRDRDVLARGVAATRRPRMLTG